MFCTSLPRKTQPSPLLHVIVNVLQNVHSFFWVLVLFTMVMFKILFVSCKATKECGREETMDMEGFVVVLPSFLVGQIHLKGPYVCMHFSQLLAHRNEFELHWSLPLLSNSFNFFSFLQGNTHYFDSTRNKPWFSCCLDILGSLS